MSTIKTFKAVLLAGVCLTVAGTARAQDNGSFDISSAPAQQQAQPSAPAAQGNFGADVTFGVGGVTSSSADFGRYNGLTKAGAGVWTGWNVWDRDAWDSGGTRYFRFTGDNINFGNGNNAPEATIQLNTGDQGSWGLTLGYDAMTYTANDNFLSILDRKGNLAPAYQSALIANGLYFSKTTVAPPASTLFGSFNATTHLATSNPVTVYGPGNQMSSEVGTRRDKGYVEGKYEIGNWLITAAVSHEHKDGSLEESMTTGGNNAGMVTFPMPVDYNTDIYTVAAAYATPDFQAKIAYEMSNFADSNSAGYAFQGWNFVAYKNTSVTPNTYTSYARSGVYSLPPNNQAHTITAEAAYNFSPETRLHGTAVYSLQLQNDPFVAATGLGYITTFGSSPTSPSYALYNQLASNPGSLDGVVNTFFGNLTLTSRPFPKFDIRAAYNIDMRDPNTKSMWIYGDPTDNSSLKYREAVPEAWTKQDVSLRAQYQVLSSTRLTAELAYKDAQRTNAITHETKDFEQTVSVLSTPISGTNLSLGYTHAERTASAPDWSMWLVQISSDCGSTLATLGCQQVPFYEAARTENAVNGRANVIVNDKTVVTLYGKYTINDYHNPNAVYNGVTSPSVGVYQDYNLQAGPDLSYQINADQDVHAFYTFMRTYRAMRALNGNSKLTGPDTANPPGVTPGTLPYYGEATTYDIQTAGIGTTWHVNEKLKLVGDYVFSYGDQGYGQWGAWLSGTAGQTYGGSPQLNTRSADHQIRLHAYYTYSERVSLYFGYRFDSLDMTDWALIGPTAGQVLTGDIPPKYNVSTFLTAVTLKI